MPSVMRYVRAKTVRVINLILARLAEGDATTPELVKVVGRHHRTARNYVKHLEKTGQIVCVRRAASNGITSLPAVWSLGDPTTLVALLPLDEDGEVDYLPRQVIVCKTWPQMRGRDPLVAALFGEARAA